MLPDDPKKAGQFNKEASKLSIYSKNEVFQKELNKVAWPAFLGKFAVNLGMGAVGGPALSAINWTGTLTDSLRNKSPAQLTEMNRDLLINEMGISRATADAFLNNSAFSPTSQTILVGALGQLGNIPGQPNSFLRLRPARKSTTRLLLSKAPN